MTVISTPLPNIFTLAHQLIEENGLSSRITARNLDDFFEEDFPSCEVVTMGNILNAWALDEKKMLIKKAFTALTPGGVFIAIENIIETNRFEFISEPVYCLLMNHVPPHGFY
jgi:hypothetical protein